MQALRRFFVAAWSLIAGLAVTARYFFKRRATVSYPHEKLTMSSAYRGRIQLIADQETGHHKCLACLQCEQVCPSSCITIEWTKDPGSRKKRPTRFDLRFDTCSLCGLCVEVCATSALEHSHAYDEVFTERGGMTFDLLAPFAGQVDEIDVPDECAAETEGEQKAAEEEE
jgi:NADH-quinone oxidoreductase subunit I